MVMGRALRDRAGNVPPVIKITCTCSFLVVQFHWCVFRVVHFPTYVGLSLLSAHFEELLQANQTAGRRVRWLVKNLEITHQARQADSVHPERPAPPHDCRAAFRTRPAARYPAA